MARHCTRWFFMENTWRMMEEGRTSNTKSLAMIVNYVILEKQRNGTRKGKNSIRDVSVSKMTTTHCFDTSKRQDIALPGNEWKFCNLSKGPIAGKWKNHFFIDMYAQKFASGYIKLTVMPLRANCVLSRRLKQQLHSLFGQHQPARVHFQKNAAFGYTEFICMPWYVVDVKESINCSSLTPGNHPNKSSFWGWSFCVTFCQKTLWLFKFAGMKVFF